MTKRPRDSTEAPSQSGRSGRQASHDVDGNGSQEDADTLSLKKARSFMATLVRICCLHIIISVTDVSRPAMFVAPGSQDAMKTDLAAAIVETTT